MRKSVLLSFILLLFVIQSCEKINLPAKNSSSSDDKDTTQIKEEPKDTTSIEVGDSTNNQLNDTLTVEKALSLGEGHTFYVKGYIVGYINGTTLSKSVFSVPDNNNATNFLIADTNDKKDIKKCMPISLGKYASYYSELSLNEHKDYLGRKICIFGNSTSYFKTIGFKDILLYHWLNNDNKETVNLPLDTTTTYIPEGRQTNEVNRFK